MSWGFWIGILVLVLIVIGTSVLVGKMLSRPRRPEDRERRHSEMMALKASGALRHRKSNRP
jgi:hypothetical protein